jgi:3-phenylpropionate/trans-cinnamate dioxygenase ferredoxin reductase subunit
MERVQYVMVGGGLAATAAIDAIRRRDKTGRLVLIGAEPHLPYDRVPLSKDYLVGRMERENVFLRPPRFYERHRVEQFLGQSATALDPNTNTITLDDGRQIPFHKLLMATGGRPRRLPIPGADLHGISYLRTLEDSDALQAGMAGARRAVVVGGGFIGCEVATAFVQSGLQTTLIEVTPAPLSLVLDTETSAFITSFLSQQGVTLRTDTAAAQFVGAQGRVERVVTNGGEDIEADVVVIGVGIAPNTELAVAAGLSVDNGVVVNEYLEAADAIYAAGDIARYYSPTLGRHLRVEHYDVALQHGRTAGANMAGAHLAYTELPYFFSHMGALHIDVIGDMSVRHRCVRRGPLSLEPGFAQFYFADDFLQAALFINGKPDLLQAARERIAQRRPVTDPAAFADETRELAAL